MSFKYETNANGIIMNAYAILNVLSNLHMLREDALAQVQKELTMFHDKLILPSIVECVESLEVIYRPTTDIAVIEGIECSGKSSIANARMYDKSPYSDYKAMIKQDVVGYTSHINEDVKFPRRKNRYGHLFYQLIEQRGKLPIDVPEIGLITAALAFMDRVDFALEITDHTVYICDRFYLSNLFTQYNDVIGDKIKELVELEHAFYKRVCPVIFFIKNPRYDILTKSDITTEAFMERVNKELEARGTDATIHDRSVASQLEVYDAFIRGDLNMHLGKVKKIYNAFDTLVEVKSE